MGTSLGNIHILGAGIDQIKACIPDAVTGVWSSDSVSVFSPDYMPGLVDKQARALSKKIPQPVLSAWIFDSDAVGFSIFQAGKCIVSHILDSEGPGKMGNIPLFCQTWQLPKEDEARLRAIWKKGNAEDQLCLTALLMGLPLYHDSQVLPEKVYQRDTDTVDQWIKDRPTLPKIRNRAKAELIQELPGFRFEGFQFPDVCPFYVSVAPCDDPHAHKRTYHLWRSQPDGTIHEIWSCECPECGFLTFFASATRVICVNTRTKAVQYDSLGLLPVGLPLGDYLLLLDDGRILTLNLPRFETCDLSCHRPDGGILWTRKDLPRTDHVLAWNAREIILEKSTKETLKIVRVSLATGETIEELDSPIGLNAYQKVWHDNAWWITHDGHIWKDGAWNKKGNYRLTKLDESFRVIAEADLPSYTQGIFFDGFALAYVYFFQEQVLAFDTTDLSLIFELNDKSFLAPIDYDDRFIEEHLWMQRGGSTVEAWDNCLTKAVSRHRLKGEIVGHHRDQDGNVCVATWDEKKNIFRVYRLIRVFMAK